MVSRKLMGIWAFLDFSLLVAGATTLALSIVWRAPNVLKNMVYSDADLTVLMVLGLALIGTFMISLFAVAQKNHVTLGLVVLNWALIIDAIGVIIIGSFIWWFTLQERNNFHGVYQALSSANRIFIQDKFQCCGYFNASDLIEFGGNYCTDLPFVESPAFLNSTNPFCVDPVTNFADGMLNVTFTTVYGYMAIIMSLILATLCVIRKRLEDERFRKIDFKRGGGGFV
jgi:hypothetical protein